MKDLNQGMLIARLTKDAELKFMDSGSAKLEFSVAFTTSKKSGGEWVNETNYLNFLNIWGKQAESLNPYMKKGQLVAIQYHLKVDSWEKDGQKVSQLKPIVDDIQLLGGSNKSGENNSQVRQNSQPVQQEYNGEGESFQEDIPF